MQHTHDGALKEASPQIIARGWVRYYWTGLIFQHIAQTAYLFIAIRWTFHRSVSARLLRSIAAVILMISPFFPQRMAMGAERVPHAARSYHAHESAQLLQSQRRIVSHPLVSFI